MWFFVCKGLNNSHLSSRLIKALRKDLKCFSCTRDYGDRSRKETGLNCRNQSEYGQSVRQCYPVKRKRRFSDQVIEEQKKAVDNDDNLSDDSVVLEDEETKIDSADSDLLQEIEDTYNRIELKVQLEYGITRESIDTSPVKTNGQYGEIFTRGLDVKV